MQNVPSEGQGGQGRKYSEKVLFFLHNAQKEGKIEVPLDSPPPSATTPYVSILHTITKKVAISSVTPVRPSALNISAPEGQISPKFYMGEFYQNPSGKNSSLVEIELK